METNAKKVLALNVKGCFWTIRIPCFRKATAGF